jgi:hypothetical protein
MSETETKECPLDLSDWEPQAIIERWKAAFKWANDKDPVDALSYERGWFVFRRIWFEGIVYRHRRRDIVEMIWRLEKRTHPVIADEKGND